MRKPLTDAFLRALKKPDKGRTELADATCRGLEFRITAAGNRSWSYRYRADSEAARSWNARRPTPHDLRRTFRTRLPQLGVPADIRDRLMNHIPSDVGTKHYDRHQYLDEKRAALIIWGKSLQAILEAT